MLLFLYRHIHSSLMVITLDTTKLGFYVLLFVLWSFWTMLIYASVITTLISSLFSLFVISIWSLSLFFFMFVGAAHSIHRYLFFSCVFCTCLFYFFFFFRKNFNHKPHQRTLRSLRQLELSVSNRTRNAQPIRDIAGLGTSVIANAGFGWSGLLARRTGDVCAAVIPRPKPMQHLNV